MKVFNPNRALVAAAALAFAVMGAQASYGQTTAPADAQASSTASASESSSSTASSSSSSSSTSSLSSSAVSSSAAASSAAAPAVAKLNDVPPPPPGKGQIVFFRPSRFVGMAVSFSVREGDKGVGKLTNGTYFILPVDPGVHEYNISFETRDNLRMEIEEGETYYVIQSIAMGIIGARPNITPSTEEAFQEKKLNVTKAKATDRTPD